MWWPAVFWILLIPLIIIEIIIFLKSRKVSWLVFALAIFTYVITVNYTIDVFSLGRNAVILILLASAGLMILLGRQFRKNPSAAKQKTTVAIILAAVMLVLFVISVVFGHASETVVPVQSIASTQLAQFYDAQGNVRPIQVQQVAVLERKISNRFFLPVPIVSHNYKACLVTANGMVDMYKNYDISETYPEVAPWQTRTVQVYFSPTSVEQGTKVTQLLIFETDDGEDSYAPCSVYAAEHTPAYTIPVT